MRHRPSSNTASRTWSNRSCPRSAPTADRPLRTTSSLRPAPGTWPGGRSKILPRNKTRTSRWRRTVLPGSATDSARLQTVYKVHSRTPRPRFGEPCISHSIRTPRSPTSSCVGSHAPGPTTCPCLQPANRTPTFAVQDKTSPRSLPSNATAPYFSYRRIDQVNSILRSQASTRVGATPTAEYEAPGSGFRVSEFGNVLKGYPPHQTDRLHGEPIPASYVWADIMLYELRHASTV